MFIYPARYFAVFLGTSWRHRVLRVSRKAKHTLKLTLFRAWNVTAYPYEFCLFWPPTLINNDKYLVGGLEHGFYDFPFSWECHHPNWLSPIFFRGVETLKQPTSHESLVKSRCYVFKSPNSTIFDGYINIYIYLFTSWIISFTSYHG